jgi:pyruvate/2-oxoglutarate dehydrogenase complex dihydrolipoamide acyltransferase (E2) component
MTPIVMPDAGTDCEPVRVSAWLVQPGDRVTVGDRVVEVLIDGVTFDITTEIGGRFATIEIPVGSLVRVGMTLGWIH